MARRGDQHNPRQDDDLKSEFEGDERANAPTRPHEWRDPEVGQAEPNKNIPLEPGHRNPDVDPETSGRDEATVRLELEEVRRRRREMFPTHDDSLDTEEAEPAGYFHGAPGGEITELLEREAQLVLELAGIDRALGHEDPDLREQEDAARRTLRRIEEMRA